MAPPTFSAKKDASPEMKARSETIMGGDNFKEYFFRRIDPLTEMMREKPELAEMFDEDGDLTDEGMQGVMEACKRAYIRDAYDECEKGLGRYEEGKPTLQVIASYQELPQEYINFGDFRFNDCSEEEFKEWATEQFDAEFKDVIKLSCEYRYNDAPDCPYPPTPADRHYDQVAPQWFQDGRGKCWWHENTCEGCGEVFVDAMNPPKCLGCR